MQQKINDQMTQAQTFSEETFLRPKECARMLGISIATFWRLCKKKELVTTKLTERTTTVSLKNLKAFIASKGAV